MPKAIVSPRELERFADTLDQIAANVTHKRKDKTRLVNEAGYVWKDAKYERFRNVFADTSAELDRFAKRARDYSAFLRAKAGKARKYLDNR